MRTLLFIFSAAVCGSAWAADSPGSELKQPSWDRATFAMYTNGQPNLQISSVKRNGDELFADFSLSNSTYEKRVPPAITIRGIQLSDGSFWPDVTLQVGDDPKGPWEKISGSSLIGKKVSVTIPPTLSVFPLRVDFLPFVPFLHRNAWGRVLLPNGEAAIIELKELKD